MDNVIQIAFAVCDPNGTYSKYLGTALSTVFEHTNSPICVHILHDNTLRDDDKTKLLLLTHQYKQNDIMFHLVNIPEELYGLHSLNQITIGTLFRLFIPSVCRCDKIIYLDVDILVNCNIEQLWNIDISNYYIAAVKDEEDTISKWVKTRYYQELGLDEQTYFNAGIILLNCKNVRADINLLEDGIGILKKYKHLAFADQDVLNILLGKRILPLLPKFNYFIDLNKPVRKELLYQECILHFSGYFKPWSCSQYDVINFYYKKMMCTPWANELEKLCDCMSEIPNTFAVKMDLKHSLLFKNKDTQPKVIILILCVLRAFLNDEYFYKIASLIWTVRNKFLYNVLYFYSLYRGKR